ncbi:MAG: M56 family metallopeptidase [Clostridia bacterium]|nr:M56 family metallopeptidase [Clostridia bacterium]
MSKIASLVILAVLLVRLCLKRAPKVFSYALWAIVLFRLLCPVSIEAPVSLIPQTEPTIESYDLLGESVTPLAALDAAGQAVGDVLNGGIGIQHVYTTNYLEDGTRRVISTNWENVWILFTKYLWLGGMAVLVLYSSISLIRLKRKLIGATVLRDNIYLADHIDSPFVMGLIRPRIYLPSSLSEKERDYILLHEQHHIRRGDHIIKLLSFAALCLHCFNPLVWMAFILSGKDMEMSCDEAVLRKLGGEIRADYSESLISLATGRRIIAGAPLAFGEGDTEGRVKNIAKWKKPAVWVIVIAVIVCALLAVCLITNPMNRDTMLLGAEYRVAEILYSTDEKWSRTDNDSPSICITADYCLWGNFTGDWESIGKLQPYSLIAKELADYTAYDAGWQRAYRLGEITDSYILRFDENSQYIYINFVIAFRTKSGDTLMGLGWEDISERGQDASDDTHLKVLVRLESTFDSYGRTGMFFDRSLAASVGGDADIFYTWSNAYIPGYIIVGFEWDESPYTDAIVVTPDDSDEKSDFGFAVFSHNEDESGYRLLQCYTYKDNGLAVDEVFTCPDLAVLDVKDGFQQKKAYARIEFKRKMLDMEHSVKGFDVFVNVLDEEKLASEPVIMTPTAANITGAFDGYLYVPIAGATYRYEIIFDDPASVTCGKLMYQFTEEAEPNDVEWRVYAVDDYPDRSVVLAEAGDDYVHLYRYSPPKAVDHAMLEKAKDKGKIVIEDGYVSAGTDRWDQFYSSTLEGESYFVEVVHYLTLENGNYDAKYYEAYKEDYPSMTEFDLAYDGTKYILHWREQGVPYVREYKYLRIFKDMLPSTQSSKTPQTVTRYVLTNDNQASLDELWHSAASSQLGDYIDFYTIYSVKN